jgi:tRNA-Thr(GGU) m(6)t(6)A37 methyltransferase TsaA
MKEKPVMAIEMQPIGLVRTDAQEVPRHWRVSDVKGSLVVDRRYQKGLENIKKGQRIVVLFYFHKSPAFTSEFLRQTPPQCSEALGVFSICSSIRPNPIGMSVLEVVELDGNVIHVKGLDMMDGTPILDVKPYVQDKYSCPSFEGERGLNSVHHPNS